MKRQLLFGLVLGIFATVFATGCDDDSKEEKKVNPNECSCSCKTDSSCTCDKSCTSTPSECSCSCKTDPSCTCDKSCSKDNKDEPPVNGDVSVEDFATESGKSCDKSFVEFCDADVAHICEDGKEILRDCEAYAEAAGNKASCQVSNESKWADCVEPCEKDTPDYATCDGKYIEAHFCEPVQSGGFYDFAYTNDPCAEACENGACTEKAPAVAEGKPCSASTCYADDVYNCDNGKYVKNKCGANSTCMPDGDKKFKCADVIAEDTPCDPSTFVDFCKDNSLYFCHSVDKVVVSEACRYECHYLADGYGLTDYAECVTPCESEEENILQCTGKDEKAYSDSYFCYPAKEGGMWLFPIQEKCTNGCNNEKTACAE